jgi:type IV pilus assembly protein PilC
VSVVSSLTILRKQTANKNLAKVIGEVRADVESGMILSRGVGEHPNIFGRLYVATIEAGEPSGTLDRVLDRLAVQIKRRRHGSGAARRAP